jgi:hypothetical protein
MYSSVNIYYIICVVIITIKGYMYILVRLSLYKTYGLFITEDEIHPKIQETEYKAQTASGEDCNKTGSFWSMEPVFGTD